MRRFQINLNLRKQSETRYRYKLPDKHDYARRLETASNALPGHFQVISVFGRKNIYLRFQQRLLIGRIMARFTCCNCICIRDLLHPHFAIQFACAAIWLLYEFYIVIGRGATHDFRISSYLFRLLKYRDNSIIYQYYNFFLLVFQVIRQSSDLHKRSLKYPTFIIP